MTLLETIFSIIDDYEPETCYISTHDKDRLKEEISNAVTDLDSDDESYKRMVGYPGYTK